MKKVFVFSFLLLFQELMSKSYEKTPLFTTCFSLVKAANRVFLLIEIKEAKHFFSVLQSERDNNDITTILRKLKPLRKVQR